MSRVVLVLLGTLAGCGSSSRPPAAAPPAPAAPAPAPVAAEQPPALRLPRTFLPTQYTARLAVDPARTSFDGEIAIAGTVSAPASVIWLHGRQLAVARAAARPARSGPEIALTVTPRGDDLLELRAAAPLAPGAWTLALAYTGPLEEVSTYGAFRQRLGEHSYVFTKLEPTHARRIFPCFDEPDNKVPWTLTLDIPARLAAVSNTPQLGEAPLGADRKRVSFATTKPLPTYLVAFAVGPLEFVDAGASARGTPIRIVTPAGRRAEAAYAASTSAKLLDAAEAWFGTPYPYEKLDMLAVGIATSWGAMENAGLIAYDQAYILLDPKRPSRDRQLRWLAIAAHEIAHQWFGNLVTAAFWDDIWLNEGFASWIGTKITHAIEPSWREDQSRLDIRNRALRADSLISARQIRQPIATPDDISNAFDGITYAKGESILAMFEAYLGAEPFQRGVRAYLAARAWGNATSSDFIAALAQATGTELAPAFASFLEQPGVPEIAATARCSGGAVTLELAQQRYVPPGAPAPAGGRPWSVPVCIAYDRGGARAEACTLLAAPTGTLALPGTGCPRWVMPNRSGTGYYRSAYTIEQVTALRDRGWSALNWLERRAILGDISTAAAEGQLPLALAMSLVPKLLAGGDRFTVGAAIALPAGLERFVADDQRAAYEAWIRKTFGAAAAKAGLAPGRTDTLDIEATRKDLVDVAAWRGRDRALIARAVQLAAGWRELPQAIRGVVLKIAVDADPKRFAQILRDVRTEPDRARRDEMNAALAAVRDLAAQRTALERLLDPALDSRETIRWLAGSTTEQNVSAAIAFFRAHEAAILARLPPGGDAREVAPIAAMYARLCDASQRDAAAADVSRAFTSVRGGPRLVKQTIESIDQCIARRAAIAPQITAWLGKR